MYLAEPKPGTHAPRLFHLASFPGSLLKNGGGGEGREPGNKANFHQALAKVKMKQSQIC